MAGLLIGLFVWATMTGINDSPSEFYISPVALGLALASVPIALASYFATSDKLRAPLAFIAYVLLFGAISSLVLSTDLDNSPFLGLWLIAVLFVGAFGSWALLTLFLLINAYNFYLMFTGGFTAEMLFGLILVGELPLLISYILWHENSKSLKRKDRAYHDLANQLDEESSKSDVVIGAINDGVIAINNESAIELINPAALRIVGWGHQDALGLNYKSVLQLLGKDGHEVDKSNDPVFEVLTTNQFVKRTDLQLQTNSGKKLNVQIVVSPIGRAGSGAIIVFHDITKEQEKERAEAEFISTASHEMRTPVASIEGYLGLALNPATATIDDKAREFITKAHESAQHLGRLFQDLLDVTKADDGRISNNPKVINLVEHIGNIIDGLKPKADAKNLRIFFKADVAQDDSTVAGGLRSVAPVYFVDLDADHLREVISNLIENAIKYTPEGQVVVDVQGNEEHVVVSITDSGIGIPAEDIPHLFQKFYRVDNTDTREIGGTGLGLYLCRRLTETMGGRLWVESEYKKGSTFYVELPRISHEEATRLIEAASAMPEQTASDRRSMRTVNATEEDKVAMAETAAHRDIALSTPIVMNHATSPAAQEPTPVSPVQPQQPVTTTETVAVADPLVGAAPSQAASEATPQTHHNAMVLPPAIKDMPSNVQVAPAAPRPPIQPPQPRPAQPSERLSVPEGR